jgi:enoyl-CoA hydratase/carnithine racemase
MKIHHTLQEIEFENNAGIGVVRIDRPTLRNALSERARTELTGLMRTLASDKSVQGVVLASQSAAFSAGQDLNEAKDFSPERVASWIDEHMALYASMLTCSKPVVAAIDGCCVGAGLQLALLADIRIGSGEAFFIMPELDDGIPCILGIWTLWDVIGRGRTTEMVLSNRRVLADEAAQWGLLSQVVDASDLLAQSVAIARHLASKPQLAFRLTKERLGMIMMREAEALTVHAKLAHTMAFASGDPRRAMNAFLQKERVQRGANG